MSFANLLMYMASVPVPEYDDEEEKKTGKGKDKKKRIDFGNDVESLGRFINNIKF